MEPVSQSRKDVWIALSDLFLDTDVTLSYDYIRRVCAGSNFTLQELNHILINEVAPVCSVNLLSVAGEWAGFNEEWLVGSIIKRSYKKRTAIGWISRLYRKVIFRKYIQEHWVKLEADISKARKRVGIGR